MELRRALVAKQKRGERKRQLTCHFRKKPGHFKREVPNDAGGEKQLANAVGATTAASSDSEEEAFVTTHALSASTRHNWIVDSGATCHMCNDKKQFKVSGGVK